MGTVVRNNRRYGVTNGITGRVPARSPTVDAGGDSGEFGGGEVSKKGPDHSGPSHRKEKRENERTHPNE